MNSMMVNEKTLLESVAELRTVVWRESWDGEDDAERGYQSGENTLMKV
jgi:hypothetical protein